MSGFLVRADRVDAMLLQLITRGLPLDARTAERLLGRALRDHPNPRFAIRLWDGREIAPSGERAFTLVFEDAATFWRCIATRDPATLAEAYVDGRVSVDGDLDAAVALAYYLGEQQGGWRDKLEKLDVTRRLNLPSIRRGVDNETRDVRAHYDEIPDALFRTFLDERMVYSCAYFAHPGQSLEDAQARKLDLVCRKLRLRPGEKLLDVGCGWGALVVWAAQRYGVSALGITLSEKQAAEARRRVAAAGVADRVAIEVRHYADLASESFDKVCSIGMYEHVGRARIASYVASVVRVLRPGGLFLNHGITVPMRSRGPTGGSFIFRHIFPGAEIDDVPHLAEEMERAGLEILDVQSLRPHYAMTLREWHRRFRLRRDEVARRVPPRILRAWDVYLAGCAHAFDRGLVNVHQILAGYPDAQGRTDTALTREELLLRDWTT